MRVKTIISPITNKKLITRMDAGVVADCHPTWIDRCVRLNLIDIEKDKTHIFVVLNSKWKSFLKVKRVKYNKSSGGNFANGLQIGDVAEIKAKNYL